MQRQKDWMCLGLELHSNFSTSMDNETSFQKNGVCVMQTRILYESYEEK